MSKPDYGHLAQKAAEERLEACEVWLDYDPSEPEPEVPNPACGPYCGCTTCMVREVLDAAWPIIEHAVKVGLGLATDVPAIDSAKVDPALVPVHRLRGI